MHRMCKRSRAMAALLLWLVAVPGWCNEPAEHELRAAFLVRFTQFVEWPGVPAEASKAFTICVLGAHPIEATLARLPELATAQGRSIQVRRVERPGAADGCEVLYIPPPQTHLLPQVQRELQGKPVLVVADAPGLADQGATISFVDKAGRLRFEINPGNAQAAGLKISSRLLKLATIVGQP